MTALLLFAAALLVVPPASPARARLLAVGLLTRPVAPDAPRGPRALAVLAGVAVTLLGPVVVGGVAGLVVAVPLGVAVAVGCGRLLGRPRPPIPDPLRLAGGWDLLAACLRSGLPVPVAVHAVAAHLPHPAGDELGTIADRLALGADPAAAWTVPESSPLAKLARAAARSARSGAALAEVAASAATEVRAGALDLASARGQRAGVLITGPLGLCFLPAFLALGVVPVVIGLAGGLAVTW